MLNKSSDLNPITGLPYRDQYEEKYWRGHESLVRAHEEEAKREKALSGHEETQNEPRTSGSPSGESERPSLRNNPEPPQESKTLDTSETIAQMENAIAELERTIGELGQQVKEGLNERSKQLARGEEPGSEAADTAERTKELSEQALEQLISISKEVTQASEQLTSRLAEDAREGMERLSQSAKEAAAKAEKIRESSEERAIERKSPAPRNET